MQGRQRDFTLWAGLAAVLHAGVGFVYLVSGLVVPFPGIVFLQLAWIAMSWWLWRLRMSAYSLIVPGIAAIVWFATLWIGQHLWHWTA